MLLALAGYKYGAFLYYIIPAILSLIHSIYPTFVVWGIFFIAFSAAAIFYILILLTDLFKLTVGLKPQMYFMTGDSMGYVFITIVLIVIAYLLFRSRPN